MAANGFHGMRVLALESRRAPEIAKLIRAAGGEPTVAAAMRELPLASNQEALQFAARLFAGEFDLVIFLTGVGIRRLTEIVESQHDRARICRSVAPGEDCEPRAQAKRRIAPARRPHHGHGA